MMNEELYKYYFTQRHSMAGKKEGEPSAVVAILTY